MSSNENNSNPENQVFDTADLKSEGECSEYESDSSSFDVVSEECSSESDVDYLRKNVVQNVGNQSYELDSDRSKLDADLWSPVNKQSNSLKAYFCTYPDCNHESRLKWNLIKVGCHLCSVTQIHDN